MSVGIDPKYLQATIYLYPSASAALDGVSVGGSGGRAAQKVGQTPLGK